MSRRGKQSLLPSLESLEDEREEFPVGDPDAELPELPSPDLSEVLSNHQQAMALESLIHTIESSLKANRYDRNAIKVAFEAASLTPEAREHTPSLEAFDFAPDRFLVVSLEGLRKTVRKTLDTILALLARFWAILNETAERAMHSTLLMRGRVVLAESYLRDVTGQYAKVREVEAGRLVRLLSTDRFPAADHVRLMENLVTLQHQLTNVRRRYVPMVVDLAEDFTKVFNRWGTIDASDWLEQLNTIARRYDPVRALTSDEPYRYRVSTQFDERSLMGRPLAGRKTIVIIPAGESAKDASARPIAQASSLQEAHVTLAELRDDRVDDEITITPMYMPVLSQNQIEGLLAKVSEVLNEIELTTKSDARRDLRRFTLTLDQLARSSRTDVPDGTVAIFQAGIAYASAVSRWTKEPYVSLINHTLNICNNTVRMCNLHVQAYKEAPTAKES